MWQKAKVLSSVYFSEVQGGYAENTHTKDKQLSVEMLLPTLSPHGGFPTKCLTGFEIIIIIRIIFKRVRLTSTGTKTRQLWNRNTKIAKPEKEKQKNVLYSYSILASFMGLMKLLTSGTSKLSCFIFLRFVLIVCFWWGFFVLFWLVGFLLEVGGCIACIAMFSFRDSSFNTC